MESRELFAQARNDPEIKVPHTKPSETPSDLDKLSIGELQSRFEATFIKDKDFESHGCVQV